MSGPVTPSSLFTDVSLDDVIIGEQPMCGVKLAGPCGEVNIALDWAEVPKVAAFCIDGAASLLPAGVCVAAPVLWSRDDKDVYILIGGDQDTWDIGFLVGMDLLRALHAQLTSSV